MAREPVPDPERGARTVTPVEFHDSEGWLLSLLAVAVLTAVAAAMAGGVGLLVLGVSLAYAAWLLHRLRSRLPRLRITEEGIEDRCYWFSPGLIRWEEVLDVRRAKWGFIEIDLVDEAGFWDRQPGWKQMATFKPQLYGLGATLIRPHFLDGSSAEIAEALEEAMDAHVLATARQREALPRPPAEEER